MCNGFSLGGGPPQFLTEAREVPRLHIRPASSFFNFVFSSSRAIRRLASNTFIPPHFAFQLYRVASPTPCLRETSAAFAPPLCSRKTAMICSSVNRSASSVRPSIKVGPQIQVKDKTQWQVKYLRAFGQHTFVPETPSSGRASVGRERHSCYLLLSRRDDPRLDAGQPRDLASAIDLGLISMPRGTAARLYADSASPVWPCRPSVPAYRN